MRHGLLEDGIFAQVFLQIINVLQVFVFDNHIVPRFIDFDMKYAAVGGDITEIFRR